MTKEVFFLLILCDVAKMAIIHQPNLASGKIWKDFLKTSLHFFATYLNHL